MMRARQVCVYPKLIYEYLEQHRGDTACSQYTGDTKLSWLVEKLVERRANGNGKLVFCQFRKEIDYLKEKLSSLGVVVGVIDGRTKDKIDTPFEVLILQIQSCCEGLNLQEHYSEMYFSSNQWNPCIEEQAIGRCYRLGQKKEVSVFRYQMSRFQKEPDAEEAPITLENYIAMVQDRKRALADEFVSSNKFVASNVM
jgi:SNF2 family DNA or RNA helicase